MHLFYDIAPNVTAFTAGKGCHGTEPGIDAREVGVAFPNPKLGSDPRSASRMGDASLEGQKNLGLGKTSSTLRESGSAPISRDSIFIPRQTHSVNVCWTDEPGECPDCDAAITATRGLCVAVKTADCIPVLLYDERQQLVAAVHAGWRGTVGRIVERTIQEMKSRGEDLHAVIGPGISLDAFEVGDEVYEAFAEAGFPMERISRHYPSSVYATNSHPKFLPTSKMQRAEGESWHLDLWEANRWLLDRQGVTRIHTAGVCTFTHCNEYYSARRETIKTGRNINGIMLI